MSYPIVYDGKDNSSLKPAGSRTVAWVMALILLSGAAVYSFVPGGKQAIQEFIWPGGSERASAAAENLVHEIRSGLPIGEAVECFCREILDGNR